MKSNFEEVLEAIANNNEGIENLDKTEFARELFSKIDSAISDVKKLANGQQVNKDGLEGKDFKILRDTLSVFLKQLGVTNQKTDRFLNQIEKDLREQKNAGTSVDKLSAAFYSLVKITEQIPSALRDVRTGRTTSSIGLSGMKEKGKQLLGPLTRDPDKFSLTPESHRKNLDHFATKLFNFIKGKQAQDDTEEEAKEKKRRHSFVDELIDSLKASRFIGGAVQDGAKLIGYLIASKLARFGTWGRALGLITIALSDTLPKIFWAGISQIINAITTVGIVRAMSGQGMALGGALGKVGGIALGTAAVVGGTAFALEGAKEIRSGRTGSGALELFGGLTMAIAPILSLLRIIPGPISAIATGVGIVATIISKIWKWVTRDKDTEAKMGVGWDTWWTDKGYSPRGNDGNIGSREKGLNIPNLTQKEVVDYAKKGGTPNFSPTSVSAVPFNIFPKSTPKKKEETYTPSETKLGKVLNEAGDFIENKISGNNKNDKLSQFINVGKGVRTKGLSPEAISAFNIAAEAYYKDTKKRPTMISGVRTDEEQAKLRYRWLIGDRKGLAFEPAKPIFNYDFLLKLGEKGTGNQWRTGHEAGRAGDFEEAFVQYALKNFPDLFQEVKGDKVHLEIKGRSFVVDKKGKIKHELKKSNLPEGVPTGAAAPIVPETSETIQTIQQVDAPERVTLNEIPGNSVFNNINLLSIGGINALRGVC